MPGLALDWFSPEPHPPLPFGWRDSDLATLHHMAEEFGIPPLEVLALFYSESGLNPKASPEGLAGLTPIIETEMGWPHGTIKQLNSGPITAYLQAVFQLWAHVQEKYVGTTFAAKAKDWGVSPGVALYTYHGFLGPAMAAHGPSAVLGKKPPVWPVTWQANGWTYQGQPIAAALGRPLSGAEVLYAGNPGLDIGGKGTITVGDMAKRVANKSAELRANPVTKPLADVTRSFDSLPTGELPPLADLFGAVRAAWKQLTGSDVRTKVDKAPKPSKPNDPASPLPAGGASASDGGALLLVAGVALAAWYLSRSRRGK